MHHKSQWIQSKTKEGWCGLFFNENQKFVCKVYDWMHTLKHILVSIFCVSRSLDFELDLIFHHISGLTVVLAKFSQFWDLLYLARFSFVLSSDNIVFTILSTGVASRVLTASLTTPSWVINLGKFGEDIVLFACRFLRRFFTVDKFVNGLIYASWLVVERMVTKTVVSFSGIHCFQTTEWKCYTVDTMSLTAALSNKKNGACWSWRWLRLSIKPSWPRDWARGFCAGEGFGTVAFFGTVTFCFELLDEQVCELD